MLSRKQKKRRRDEQQDLDLMTLVINQCLCGCSAGQPPDRFHMLRLTRAAMRSPRLA